MASHIAAIVGVGPGLGSAVAKRFGKEGYSVALIARKTDFIDKVKEEINNSGGKAKSFTADVTDAKSINSAFENIRKEIGNPDVLVYNAGSFAYGSVLDISPEQFEQHWKSNCFGGFVLCQTSTS